MKIYEGERLVAEHVRLIARRYGKTTQRGHHQPFARTRIYRGPCQEERLLVRHLASLDAYVQGLKQRVKGRGVIALRRLLELKRTYPQPAFQSAVEQALHYGLFDLNRLESMMLKSVAGDFFKLDLEGPLCD